MYIHTHVQAHTRMYTATGPHAHAQMNDTHPRRQSSGETAGPHPSLVGSPQAGPYIRGVSEAGLLELFAVAHLSPMRPRELFIDKKSLELASPAENSPEPSILKRYNLQVEEQAGGSSTQNRVGGRRGRERASGTECPAIAKIANFSSSHL